MRTQLFVLFALLFAQSFATPAFKAFTADLAITAQDKSISQVSWFTDVKQNAEKIVFHRQGGLNTVNYRLYSMGVEFLLIEGEKGDSCHLLPMADKRIPSSISRSSIFTEAGQVVSWSNVRPGAVSAEEFELPQSCAEQAAQGGLFCSTCISVGQQVVNLGCNATAAEIANLCGNLFSGVCKAVLDQLCAGTCTLEECAQQACCLVDLCTGSSCNSTSAAMAVAPVAVIPAEDKAEGIFCDSCIAVGKQVISLGCNATTSEISKLCGNVFSALCKSVLETFCSGACQLEDCAADTCCLFDLCTGTQCASNSTSTSGNAQPHRLF